MLLNSMNLRAILKKSDKFRASHCITITVKLRKGISNGDIFLLYLSEFKSLFLSIEVVTSVSGNPQKIVN